MVTLLLNGSTITTSAGSASLFNSTATTLNIGGAATTVAIGAGTGTTTLNNNLAVNLVDNNTNALAIADGSYNFININTTTGANNISFGNTNTNPTYSFLGTGAATFSGDINANSGTVATNQTTGNLFNTTATTLNIGGAATTLDIGANTGTATINNAISLCQMLIVGIGVSPISALEVSHPLTLGATGKAAAIFNQTENEDILTASYSGTTEFTVANNGNLTTAGNVAVNGGSVTTTQTTANLFNTTVTNLSIGGAATTLGLGATTGTTTINNNLALGTGASLTTTGNVSFTRTDQIMSLLIPVLLTS